MDQSSNALQNFVNIKSLIPDTIKKCHNINNAEKNGQTIFLDNHTSKHFSKVISCTPILQTFENVEKGSKSQMDNIRNNHEKNKHTQDYHEKKIEKFTFMLANF
ncbi:uncharacterized protein LOC126838485 isoform X2 [Adelges cooleyi]|uniref:uncharacterized protein LOC126838485 isoform X2 n=1 Tax=Adelges cooleyi TaxID=133065 RepID=UPI00217F88CF|nr:uncharacterized protein LOC126838485 isoform X2 [Adelges cooleyi]